MVRGEESRMQGIMSPQSKDSPDNRSRQVKSSNLGHRGPRGLQNMPLFFLLLHR